MASSNLYDPEMSWNKKPPACKKDGNWFEEMTLLRETGVQYYPNPKDKSSSLLTNDRVMFHTEQIKPKDYISNTRRTIIDPKNHPEYKTLMANPVGPRKMLYESKISSEVQQMQKEKFDSKEAETRRVLYRSVYQDNYNKADFKSTLVENDPSIRIQTSNADYSTDTPITYYSDSISNAPTNVSFPVTFINSSNPFRKSSAFSADAKFDPCARKTETNERPTPYPTFVEHRLLLSFRKRLIAHTQLQLNQSIPGAAVRKIVSMLWTIIDQMENYNAPISFLINVISQELDFAVNDSEMRAFIIAFVQQKVDVNEEDYLNVVDVISLIMPPLSPRRLELIGILFSLLEKNTVITTAGLIDKDQLNQFFVPGTETGSFQQFCEDLPYGISLNIEDLVNYYSTVSAEIDDNNEFEDYLRKSWKL